MENIDKEEIILDVPTDGTTPVEGETPATPEPSIYDDIAGITGFRIEGQEALADDVPGFAEYVKRANDYVIQEYNRQLQEEHPDIYNALLYAKNGGNPIDIFTIPKDFVNLEFKEEEDFAAQIYKEYFKRKGIDDDIVEDAINSATDNGSLIGKAKKYFDELKQTESKLAEQKVLEQQQYQKELDTIRQTMVDNVAKTIDSGVIGSKTEFFVPTTHKKEFKSHFINNAWQEPDGSYSYVMKFDDKNIKEVLQYAYFVYKKGDLSDLIQTRASTETARRLVGGVQKEQKPGASKLDSIFEKLKGNIK